MRNNTFAVFATCLCLSLLSACGSSESEPAGGAGQGGSDSGTGGSSGVCSLGDTRECVGPAACKGGQVCGADKVWSGCDCRGGTDGGQDTGIGGQGGAEAGTDGSAADGDAGPKYPDIGCTQDKNWYQLNGDKTCNEYNPAGICSSEGDLPLIEPIPESYFNYGTTLQRCFRVRTPGRPGVGKNCGGTCSGANTVAAIRIPFGINPVLPAYGWGICAQLRTGTGSSDIGMDSWRLSWEDKPAACGAPSSAQRTFIPVTTFVLSIETDNPDAPVRVFDLCFERKDKC